MLVLRCVISNKIFFSKYIAGYFLWQVLDIWKFSYLQLEEKTQVEIKNSAELDQAAHVSTSNDTLKTQSKNGGDPKKRTKTQKGDFVK